MSDYELELDSLETDEEEENYEKDRSRETNRRWSWAKAISRFEKMRSAYEKTSGHPLGYYRNNNEANANVALNENDKTTNELKPRDKKRLDSMKDDLKEN